MDNEEVDLEIQARKLIEIEKLKKDKSRFKKVWAKATEILKEKKKDIELGEKVLQPIKPSRL